MTKETSGPAYGFNHTSSPLHVQTAEPIPHLTFHLHSSTRSPHLHTALRPLRSAGWSSDPKSSRHQLPSSCCAVNCLPLWSVIL